MAQKEEKAWFQDWFSSPYYGLLYRHRNDDEARFFIQGLIERRILEVGFEVLDLACGNGRHSRNLAEAGMHVSGMDLSEEQIAIARQTSPAEITYIVGDMRFFSLEKSFDAVLNLFTSFGYFETTEENFSVLQCVAKHLKGNGVLVLDYFNSEKVRSSLPARGETTGTDVRIAYHKYVNDDKVIKDIEVHDHDKVFHFREKVQLISRSDFSKWLHEAGFEVLHTFGGYSLEDFDEVKSDRLILIAKLR